MSHHARPTVIFPAALRELEVLRVWDVTSGMRRVTLTGEQLAAHTTPSGVEQAAFASPGFDDDFRLFFAHPGQSEPVLPALTGGRLQYPTDPRPIARAYTVRRYDPATRELDVDFVTHGIGIASTWAARAVPGDKVHLAGPWSSAGLPIGFDWWLVAGDETALPAIARLLEEAPGDLRAQVVIEVAEFAHRQELRELPGVEVTWVSRDGAEPATTTHLLDAVRSASWWDGEAFAWIAGEQAVVRDLRRHLIEDRGLEKTAIDFTGYWKRSTVVTLDGDVAVPDPEKNTDAYQRFHDLAELVPPMAIRVAVGLRLGDLISRGVTTARELAERTASDERALGKLLRYLRTIGLLTETAPGRYALTETGEYLADDFWAEHLDPNGLVGRQEVGIVGLAESICTGRAAYTSVTGRPFTAVSAELEYEHALLEQAAEYANYLAPALAELPAFTRAGRVVVRSRGANTEARELTARHPGVRVTISAPPSQATWYRQDLPVAVSNAGQRERIDIVAQSLFDPGPAADVVLLVYALDGLADEDAAAALRIAASTLTADGRVMLIEHTLDTGNLDEHDSEADLIALTRDGTGLRTDAELDAVIEDAGLDLSAISLVGFGITVRELAVTTAGRAAATGYAHPGG